MDAILELATQLGEAIKADPRMARYAEAREAYAADRRLQSALTEYKTQKVALNEEKAKDTSDADFIAAIEDRIAVLYKEIVDSPVMEAFSDAEGEINALLNRVNRTITQTISGEESSCGGGCDSCAGCSH